MERMGKGLRQRVPGGFKTSKVGTREESDSLEG